MSASLKKYICAFCAFLWLTFLCGFWWHRLGDGVAVGAVGGAVAAVLGLFLGHVNALLGFAVELRVGAMIETVFGINPDLDRWNTP